MPRSNTTLYSTVLILGLSLNFGQFDKPAAKIGLKASHRMVFYNGKIECRLLKYELYKGTRQK